MLTTLNSLYHHPFLHFFPKNLIFTLTQMKKQHLVLVHGTNHGAWCWYKLITRLKSAGHKVTALDLGGSGVNFDQVSSIDDYVKLLIQFMAHLPEEERVILVGHSYGGIPISLAMEKFPSKILVAVFVAAFMPSISSPPANVVLELSRRMSMESLMDSKFDWTDEANDGRNLVMFGPHHMRTSIYQNCQPEDLELAKSLMRESGLFLKDLAQESLLTKDGFGSVERVYIVAEEDKILKKDLQEWFIQNSPIQEGNLKFIPGADHMVKLSKPDELCSSLLEILIDVHEKK
ncbi:Methyl jasmonate esterase 1 [Linum perenne]